MHGHGLTQKAAIRTWLAATLALFLVFWLPYHVPVQPAVSDSYLFGFSNKAFEGLLLLFVAVLVISERDLALGLPGRGASAPIPRRILFGVLAAVAVICAGMYLLTRGLSGYDESRYLIDRVRLLAEGRTPYREFEFAYGPLLLYGPLAIARIFGIGIESGYYAFWTLTSTLGYYLLYETINRIDFPCGRKRTIFLVFSLGVMPGLLNTGANYTLLRFVLPAFFALLLHRSFGDGGSLRRHIRSLLLVVLFTAAIGVVSPELAIAYALGGLGFFAVYGRLWEPARLAAYGMTIVLLGVLTYCSNRLGVFDTLKEFAGGGYSFPIIPAPHILLLIFCIVGSAGYVVARRRSKVAPDGMVFLIATAVPALPAALGRCDEGHALWCAFGITLAGTILAAGDARIWRWYRYAFVLIVALFPLAMVLMNAQYLLSNLAIYHIFKREADGKHSRLDGWVERDMSRSLGPERIALLKASAHRSLPIDLAGLFPQIHDVVWVPFGFSPDRIGLYHDVRLDPGRYSGMVNVVSEKSVAYKISELGKNPDRQLLLPRNIQKQCLLDPAQEIESIRILFLFPYKAKPAHPESLTQPLCSYILEHYRREQDATRQTFGYELWAPLNN
jgi:hypothetical protein